MHHLQHKSPIVLRFSGVILALLSLAGSAVPSYASTSSSGSLSGIIVVREGKLFFRQSGTRDPRPGCASVDRWVIDVNTPSGQAEAAILLTALSQNRLVSVTGTGICTDWPDTETVEALFVDN